MQYHKSLLVSFSLALVSNIAFAESSDDRFISQNEAAAITIKPFVGVTSVRGSLDYFLHSAVNIAHDVLHPIEPPMFGQPGFDRILQVSRAAPGRLSESCELSGGYVIDGMSKGSRHDDSVPAEDPDSDTGNRKSMGLTFEGCRFNMSGWIVQLDGSIRFVFRDDVSSDRLEMLSMRFGHPGVSGAAGFRTTHISTSTGEIVSELTRNYRIDGVIPSDFDAEYAYAVGEYRYRVRGEIATSGTVNFENEAVSVWSLVFADNVRVSGANEIGLRAKPDSSELENAYTQTVELRAGAFHGISYDGRNESVSSFESSGLRIEDIEFVDTDSGAHHLRFEGRGDIYVAAAGSPLCQLGKFWVKTLDSLYVPPSGTYPSSGALVIDKRVRASFGEGSSVAVTAAGQTTEYAEFSELSSAASCFIY